MIRWSFLVFFLLRGMAVYAQEEKVTKQDSVVLSENNIVAESDGIQEVFTNSDRRRPQKAALRSTIFPGLGQIYNKSYWKLPIIYGGHAFFAFQIHDNSVKYKYYLNALLIETGKIPDLKNPTQFTETQLRRRTEIFRRNRDYFIIISVLWYALNIVEAHVDAHLLEFDLNEDLAFSVKPTSVQNKWNIPNAGIILQLKINP